MARFVLRPRASADIDGIWDYTENQWGTAQAIRYTRGIWATIEKIAESPGRGRRCDEAGPDHFKMNSGSHVIIYRVIGDKVGVVRVLHQAMDIGRQF